MNAERGGQDPNRIGQDASKRPMVLVEARH
eukprot:SAG31_NODE_14549_length_800_cov_0.803138_1_plen_29_part_01